MADILRAHGESYRRTHNLARCQRRAMRAIENCRTAQLGGHKHTCDRCGAARITYNSCRNRHCPKCQTLDRQRWVQARLSDLLSVAYFHIVFTLPHQLNVLAQTHPRVIYNLLFAAASDTLLTFARDPKHLGGTPGVTAVLHTWGRNLSQHVHLHCIVTGGALAADGLRFIRSRRKFLFPVRALSVVFRAKYLELLEQALHAGQLGTVQLETDPAASPTGSSLLTDLRHRDWIVYCKPPLAGPKQVLDYLGRYTHRVAISNDRLVGFHQGLVRFRWKDHADAGKLKVMTLAAEEFIRRFLLHVLPDRFMRIRHFGLLANRARSKKLALCRQLLHQPAAPGTSAPESTQTLMLRLTGLDITLCPVCRTGRLYLTAIIAPLDSSNCQPNITDTS
ncbi:MAG: IS91 family transposase [Pseudomonadota bacterium]